MSDFPKCPFCKRYKACSHLVAAFDYFDGTCFAGAARSEMQDFGILFEDHIRKRIASSNSRDLPDMPDGYEELWRQAQESYERDGDVYIDSYASAFLRVMSGLFEQFGGVDIPHIVEDAMPGYNTEYECIFARSPSDVCRETRIHLTRKLEIAQ